MYTKYSENKCFETSSNHLALYDQCDHKIREYTDGICYRATDGMVMKDSVWGTFPRVCKGTAFSGLSHPVGGTQRTTGSATSGCLVGRHNLCTVAVSSLKFQTFIMNIIKF